MKKLSIYTLVILLSMTIVPMPVKAGPETNPASIPVPAKAEATEANVLLARVNEIHAMDKSRLSASEKKQLRKEVRSTKKRLKEMGGGVYLSVGAIIIIILLLILLL
jgi:hypothetical protein